MKAIVTGSAGFIGRHLCEYLRQRGDEVVEMDIDGERPVDLFRVGIPSEADILYHLAADPSRESKGTFEVNTDMADDVLAWHAQNPKSTVVFASTWMVAVPGSIYGMSKLESEAMLIQGVPHDKLRIIRLPNIYGPGGHGVLDIWKAALANGEPILIHSDGSQQREFLHVHEAVEILANPPAHTLTHVHGQRAKLADIAFCVVRSPERRKLVSARDSSPEIWHEFPRLRDPVQYINEANPMEQWRCRACGRASEPFDRDFEAPLGWSSVHVRDGQGVDDFHYCDACTGNLQR